MASVPSHQDSPACSHGSRHSHLVLLGAGELPFAAPVCLAEDTGRSWQVRPRRCGGWVERWPWTLNGEKEVGGKAKDVSDHGTETNKGQRPRKAGGVCTEAGGLVGPDAWAGGERAGRGVSTTGVPHPQCHWECCLPWALAMHQASHLDLEMLHHRFFLIEILRQTRCPHFIG